MHPDGVREVVATEYGPIGSAPQARQPDDKWWKLYEELRSLIDGGSESMTHEDAVEQVKQWVEADEQITPTQECGYDETTGTCTQNPCCHPQVQQPAVSFDQVARALEGVDRTETSDDTGWWATSAGAAFGAEKLDELRKLFAQQPAPADVPLLDDDWIIDMANEVHRAMPAGSDEQEELLTVVREAEKEIRGKAGLK